jgi:thiamine biosynthesis protein ThiI
MIILVRYGEIHLKGLNRPYFERSLARNMRRAIADFSGAAVSKGEGRFYVKGFDEQDAPAVMRALSFVFGIHSMSPAYETGKTMEEINEMCLQVMHAQLEKMGRSTATFKVISKRADKRFPLNSMQICAETGAYLLRNFPDLTVDVHHPEISVFVEVREKALCYCDVLPGQGGLPAGCSGRAVLLLSGGIDSPVAGHMTAKRGVTLEAVHFTSPPYTSEAAKQKVADLAGILAKYSGPIRLHVVHFTEIQTEIYKNCPHEELVIIMRRFMMRIAEKVARTAGAAALVTGESIGQVASQTLDSMSVTGAVATMPVLRPLIGMDKLEIMARAEAIGTYETSILPYEDCCTVFVPKHPVTHPRLERIERSEARLPVDTLLQKALDDIEVIEI